jgi:pimeloyl-ACP methyl ester carboxylesterase
LSWRRQFDSVLATEFRLVALDNRGHGMSAKPLETKHYTDPRLWADDIAAVISSLGLERPARILQEAGRATSPE